MEHTKKTVCKDLFLCCSKQNNNNKKKKKNKKKQTKIKIYKNSNEQRC